MRLSTDSSHLALILIHTTIQQPSLIHHFVRRDPWGESYVAIVFWQYKNPHRHSLVSLTSVNNFTPGSCPSCFDTIQSSIREKLAQFMPVSHCQLWSFLHWPQFNHQPWDTVVLASLTFIVAACRSYLVYEWTYGRGIVIGVAYSSPVNGAERTATVCRPGCITRALCGAPVSHSLVCGVSGVGAVSPWTHCYTHTHTHRCCCKLLGSVLPARSWYVVPRHRWKLNTHSMR